MSDVPPGESEVTLTQPAGRLRTADLVVRSLHRLGVRRLFGVHTLHLYDALADRPDIVPIVTRNEAGAAFAADVYTRVTGRPGVVSVVLERLEATHPSEFETVQHLRAAIPPDAVVVNDLNALSYWLRLFFDVERPGSFIYADGFYTLGSGLPTALGVKAARPDQPVVVISGDGGIGYGCFELSVAQLHGLPVVVVLVNDNAFGAIRSGQRSRYGGREIGVDLRNPSFPELAMLFGHRACTTDSATALAQAVSIAIDSGEPWLIEFTGRLSFGGSRRCGGDRTPLDGIREERRRDCGASRRRVERSVVAVRHRVAR